jgi:hypothetical protein
VDSAHLEQRAAFLALISALLVALRGGATARWVGRPLAALGTAMAGAHGATGGAVAPEIGPREFRELTRLNGRAKRCARERESAARAMLLTLEERAPGSTAWR